MNIRNVLVSGLISVLNLPHVFAQTNVYHPFPENNAEWIVTTQVSGGCWGVCANKYVITGPDTLIGSFNYVKINMVNLSAVGPDPCCINDGCCMYYRNDSIAKKVYFINEFGLDAILYDFNLQVGDTIPGHMGVSGGLWPIVVSNIDSIQILNSYHKRWNMIIMGETRSIIEGVGNTNGLFEPISLASEITFELACASIGNTVIYGFEACNIVAISEKTDESLLPQAYPNPSSSFLMINNSNKNIAYVANLYDLSGNNLKSFNSSIPVCFDVSSFPNGMYFIVIHYNNGFVHFEKFIIIK